MLTKIDTYLRGEGYTRDSDGNYMNTENNFMISIHAGSIEGVIAPGRQDAMTESEKEILAKVRELSIS